MAPLPPAVAEALARFRKALEARFGPRLLELRLFGSYARGDFDADSDVDVLVVVEALEPEERREVIERSWDPYPELLVYLSPLALSAAEWARLRAREYRIAREVDADGVPV
ncbi:MAG: nucleotidyltransferase domain-containing protein [Polyangiaceae bacterium]|nr:nucleotidyltransferase domain-containing protein [Polyangiaceae bacterium]